MKLITKLFLLFNYNHQIETKSSSWMLIIINLGRNKSERIELIACLMPISKAGTCDGLDQLHPDWPMDNCLIDDD